MVRGQPAPLGMATTANTITLKNLVSATGPAVTAALKRHSAKPAGGLILNPGTLAGPLLDPATDIRVAQQIADDVAKAVQGQFGQGLTSIPALSTGVLITKSHILCGFFPYPAPEIGFE